MKVEKIQNLIGKLKCLQTFYISQLDILQNYINILDRFTWKDVPEDEANWRNENKYIFAEVEEYLSDGIGE